MAPSEESTSKWDRQTGRPATAVRHTRQVSCSGHTSSCPSAEENPTDGGRGGAGRLQKYFHDSYHLSRVKRPGEVREEAEREPSRREHLRKHLGREKDYVSGTHREFSLRRGGAK